MAKQNKNQPPELPLNEKPETEKAPETPKEPPPLPQDGQTQPPADPTMAKPGENDPDAQEGEQKKDMVLQIREFPIDLKECLEIIARKRQLKMRDYLIKTLSEVAVRHGYRF